VARDLEFSVFETRKMPDGARHSHSQSLRMGQTASSTLRPASSSSSAGCPVDHSAFAKHPQASSSAPASCPVDHSLANSAPSSSSAASCPVDHASSSKSAYAPPAQCPVPHSETLDPRNNLPVLTQERSPSQTTDLPTERTASSIPRDGVGNWEYPSPQQFYNALVRKGWETPENEIETIVEIHNFLNEKAWEEVQKWEAEVNKYVSVTRLDGRLFKHAPGV
jgi:Cytochrome c/c1 heme lyase